MAYDIEKFSVLYCIIYPASVYNIYYIVCISILCAKTGMGSEDVIYGRSPNVSKFSTFIPNPVLETLR